MEEKVKLSSLFNSHKDELEQQLRGFILPQNAEQIQMAISRLFDRLFDMDGDFRQSLTQSEDFVLQASLKMLNSQQSITNGLIQENGQMAFDGNCKQEPNFPYTTILGTGIGATAGALIGAWAAVVGAIAGNALSIYIASHRSKQEMDGSVNHSHQIDSIAFVNIIGTLCDSIDGIIDTYRVQVDKIRSTYEKREKPALQNEYSLLLEQIVNVDRLSITLQNDIPERMIQAIRNMVLSLENYNLSIKDGKIINI